MNSIMKCEFDVEENVDFEYDESYCGISLVSNDLLPYEEEEECVVNYQQLDDDDYWDQIPSVDCVRVGRFLVQRVDESVRECNEVSYATERRSKTDCMIEELAQAILDGWVEVKQDNLLYATPLRLKGTGWKVPEKPSCFARESYREFFVSSSGLLFSGQRTKKIRVRLDSQEARDVLDRLVLHAFVSEALPQNHAFGGYFAASFLLMLGNYFYVKSKEYVVKKKQTFYRGLASHASQAIMETVSAAPTEIAEWLSAAIKGLKIEDLASLGIKTMALISSANALSYAYSFWDMLCAVCNVLCVIGVEKKVCDRLINLLSPRVKEDDVAVNKAGTGDALEWVLTIILTLIGTMTGGFFKSRMVDSFFKIAPLTGLLDKIKKKSGDFVEIMCHYISKFLVWLLGPQSEFAADLAAKMDASDRRKEVLLSYPGWVLRCSDVMVRVSSATEKLTNPSLLRDLKAILDEGEILYSTLCATDGFPVANRLALSTNLRELKLAYQKLLDLAGACNRVEPSVLYVVGPPNVGKSHFAKVALGMLATKLNQKTSFDANKFYFARGADSKFWDGYGQQTAVLYDDLFKDCQNPQSQSRDATEWIGVVSNQPFPAEQAALSDKGMYFTSEYIIGTSNYLFPKTHANSGAICRRFHTQVLMVWNGGDQTHRMDYSNVSFFVNNSPVVTDLYNGVYRAPYSAKRDYPNTIFEFNAWEHNRHFTPITPGAIVQRWMDVLEVHATSGGVVNDQVDLFLNPRPVPQPRRRLVQIQNAGPPAAAVGAPAVAVASAPVGAVAPALDAGVGAAGVPGVAVVVAPNVPAAVAANCVGSDSETEMEVAEGSNRIVVAEVHQEPVGRGRPVWDIEDSEGDEFLDIANREPPIHREVGGGSNLFQRRINQNGALKRDLQRPCFQHNFSVVHEDDDVVNMRALKRGDFRMAEGGIGFQIDHASRVVVPEAQWAGDRFRYKNHYFKDNGGILETDGSMNDVLAFMNDLGEITKPLFADMAGVPDVHITADGTRLMVVNMFGVITQDAGWGRPSPKCVSYSYTDLSYPICSCSRCWKVPFTNLSFYPCQSCSRFTLAMFHYATNLKTYLACSRHLMLNPCDTDYFAATWSKERLARFFGFLGSTVAVGVIAALLVKSIGWLIKLFKRVVCKNHGTYDILDDEDAFDAFFDELSKDPKRNGTGKYQQHPYGKGRKTLLYMGEHYDYDSDEYDPAEFKNWKTSVYQKHGKGKHGKGRNGGGGNSKKYGFKNRVVIDVATNESIDFDETQFGEDLNRLSKHVVYVRYIRPSGQKLRMYGVVISAGMVLLPSHLIPHADRNNEQFSFMYVCDGVVRSEKVPRSAIVFQDQLPKIEPFREDRVDLITVNFRNMPAMRKITGAFVTDPFNFDYKKVAAPCLIAKPATTIDEGVASTDFVFVSSRITSLEKDVLSQAVDVRLRTDVLVVPDTFLKMGDCGSLLLVVENGQLRISGLYVSGSADVGNFQPVSKDLIEGLTIAQCKGFAGEPAIAVDDPEPVPFEERNGTVCLGKWVDATPAVRFIPPTGIVKSTLQLENPNLFGHPCATAPARLNKTAFMKALEKKTGEEGVYHPTHLETASRMLSSMLSTTRDLEPYNWEQACDGVDTMKQLSMDSSPGLPWITQKPAGENGPAREWLFDTINTSEGKFYRPKSVLKCALESHWKNLVEGVANPSLFKSSLKDERRDLERVLANKTRLFTACPVEKVLADRRLLGPFYNAYKQNRSDWMHGVGISHMSTEWSEFVSSHLARPFSCALDYSNFDNSLPLSFTTEVYRRVAECYKPEWKSAIMASCTESTNSYYMYDGFVMRSSHGNPSGHFFTTILNSLTNCFIMFYAWSFLSEQYLNTLDNNLSGFRKHVTLTVYGDDLIFSVSSEASEFFNGITFCEAIAHTGVKATNSDKSGEVAKWTPKENLTFLKRSFIECPYAPKMWVGVLPKEIIEEIPMWRWEESDPRNIINSIENALQEATLWSEEYADGLWKKLTTLSDFSNRTMIVNIDINEVKRRVIGVFQRVGEKRKKITYFNSKDPEHSWLSNFHPCKIRHDGWVFPTLEHAYVYEKRKYHGKETESVFQCLEPGVVKVRSKNLRSDGWDKRRVIVMKVLVAQKFDQNPDLQALLLATGSEWLVEATPDRFWGAGMWPDALVAARGVYPGRNMLGAILSAQRSKYLV